MKNEDYNGWANRSTWNVMLWLDNDESCYRAYRERVKELKASNIRLSGTRARSIAIAILGDTTPDGIRTTAKCIDWKAIAEAMSEE